MDRTSGSFVPRSSQGLFATKKRESRRNRGSRPAARGQSQTVSPPVGREFLDSSGGPGFDEFGRVKRIQTQRNVQAMMDYAYAWQKSPLAPVSRTDAGPLGSEQNQYYDYDGLERLVGFKRGQEEQNPQYTKDWTLTALGNWDVVSDPQLTDQRDHNSVNEISSRKLNGTTVLPKDDPNDPSYDPEGNLRKIPSDNAGGTSDYFEAVYDPWNKLVRIQAGSQVKAKYVRDALGRIAWDETSGEHYYWSASWQRLAVYEEQEGSLALKKEEVWGVTYIDEILCAFDTEGGGTKTRVYVQDANWNVAAVYDSSDNTDSLELIKYTPYGKPTFWKKVSNSWEEQSQLSSRKGADHLFQGRWLCAYESSGLQLQLYHFRHRAYSPTLGRFAQQDLIGARIRRIHPTDLYQFCLGRPLFAVDPAGTHPCENEPFRPWECGCIEEVGKQIEDTLWFISLYDECGNECEGKGGDFSCVQECAKQKAAEAGYDLVTIAQYDPATGEKRFKETYGPPGRCDRILGPAGCASRVKEEGSGKKHWELLVETFGGILPPMKKADILRNWGDDVLIPARVFADTEIAGWKAKISYLRQVLLNLIQYCFCEYGYEEPGGASL